MAWRLSEYSTEAGNVPVVEYLESAPPNEQKKAAALILLLQERGNTLREPHSKALGDGLYELRDVTTGVRVFYTMLPEKRAVLLGGMTKKRDEIPAGTLRRIRAMKEKVHAVDREQKKRAQPKNRKK